MNPVKTSKLSSQVIFPPLKISGMREKRSVSREAKSRNHYGNGSNHSPIDENPSMKLVPVKLNNSLWSGEDRSDPGLDNYNQKSPPRNGRKGSVNNGPMGFAALGDLREFVSDTSITNNQKESTNDQRFKTIDHQGFFDQQANVLQPKDTNFGEKIDTTVNQTTVTEDQRLSSTGSSYGKNGRFLFSDDKENGVMGKTGKGAPHSRSDINVIEEEYSLRKMAHAQKKIDSGEEKNKNLLNNRNYIENLRRRVKKRLEDEFDNYEQQLEDKDPENRVAADHKHGQHHGHGYGHGHHGRNSENRNPVAQGRSQFKHI
jgi:hypothetical protein